MSIGHNMARGRRRRVLNEELRNASDGSGSPKAGEPPIEGARYTDAASIENHPQVSDFVPRKIRTYGLYLFVALASVAGLATLDLASGAISAAIGGVSVPALEMTAPGGLASLFASGIFAGIAIVSVLVYSLRRHRVDDYRARYRAWLSLSLSSLIACVCASTSLHVVCSETIARWTGWTGPMNGAGWWIGATAAIGVWIGYRVLPDLRERMASFGAVSLAIVCYGGAVVVQLSPIAAASETRLPVIAASLTLCGHIFILLSVTWYARYVVLDVQGLIEHRATSLRSDGSDRKLDKMDRTASPKVDELGDDDASGAQPRLHRTEEVREWTDGSEPEEDAYGDDPIARKTAKSDRKRRRTQERHRRAA